MYILISRANFQREVALAAVLVVLGTAAYMLRARSRREWPFKTSGDFVIG
jgi:hypothetical protein